MKQLLKNVLNFSVTFRGSTHISILMFKPIDLEDSSFFEDKPFYFNNRHRVFEPCLFSTNLSLTLLTVSDGIFVVVLCCLFLVPEFR